MGPEIKPRPCSSKATALSQTTIYKDPQSPLMIGSGVELVKSDQGFSKPVACTGGTPRTGTQEAPLSPVFLLFLNLY